MKYIKLSILWLLFISTLTSCKDRCGDEANCPDGKVSVNGECECPEGTINNQGVCQKIEKHSFIIGETSCDCIGEGRLTVQYDPKELKDSSRWNKIGRYFTTEFTFAYDGGGIWNQVDYFPDNDSLYFWWFSDARFFDCRKNSLAKGKFYDDKNKIALTIYFFEGMEGAGSQDRITDSCTLLLTNGM